MTVQPSPAVPGPYVTDVRVRWTDLDAFGHVNNAKTITLLEEARVDWLFEHAAAAGLDDWKDGIVVHQLTVEYLRPIGFREPVTVAMVVGAMTAASFRVDYRVLAGSELAARASTLLVPVDPATFKPRRLTAAERLFLSRYRAP